MIEMNNLSFGYAKKDKLFSGIELQIETGGVCGLLGKNGSGKTTLLKLIAGLIFPTAGVCKVLHQIPKTRQPSFLEEIYFLAEDLFVPDLTVDNYVKFYSPFYPKFDQQLLQNYLNEFELSQQKLLTKFSYGQKKKFLLAFGLATGCRLFILDEPTNGLDIPSKTQFRKLLAASATPEKLFIVSTHQVHDVENLIDSVLILEDGKIIFHQTLLEVAKRLAFVHQKTEPEHTDCLYYEKYLGGYAAVVPNTANEDTQVDLEILFNAVLSNMAKMQQIFHDSRVD